MSVTDFGYEAEMVPVEWARHSATTPRCHSRAIFYHFSGTNRLLASSHAKLKTRYDSSKAASYPAVTFS